ncbi:hypothetical protein H8356DRAFT_1360803 [Neocallimastix lanati (nom. inval.)]|nr:hypothetical protein H8356DRAFT_1360803 [Neocallimastix sp. JGI-2020a]
MTYPDINNLHNLREFSEIYTNNPLIENVHMKRYQVLPIRYISPENEVELESHSQHYGLLNFINTYKKSCIIIVKSKEVITEFTKCVKAWYSYTFNYYPPLPNVNNYKEFIKNTDTDSNDNKSRIIFIEFKFYLIFNTRKTERRNAWSPIYYGLNSPNTSMNYIGSFIQYSKFQNTKGTYARGSTYYYGNIMEEPQNMNNMGINYVKATCNDISIVIPLLSLLNSAYLALHAKYKINNKIVTATLAKLNLSKYILNNNNIIHHNPFLQDIITRKSKDIKNNCYKLYYILKEINCQEIPDGLLLTNKRIYNKEITFYTCEDKYKEILKYNQALKDSSIESLVHVHSNLNDHQNTTCLANKE